MLGLHEHGENTHAYLELAGNFALTFIGLLVFAIVSTVPQNRLPTGVELFWCCILSLGEALAMYGVNTKVAQKESKDKAPYVGPNHA